MKDFKIKFRLYKWHFYLLGLILLNWGIGIMTDYRLNSNLIYILKIILYLTGIVLFFKTLRPFKLMAVYFSFYVISVFLTGFFFLFGGIFLAVMSSFALYPIFPKQTKYKTETIKIYDHFQGFLSSCCSYEVVEPKLFIFEKHLGYIKIEGSIDTDIDEFSYKNNTIIHKYKLDYYEYDRQTTTARDTTVILDFE
jgi:hypothetical protein